MADQAPAAAGAETAPPGKYNPTDNGLQRIRSYTGLYVVLIGDVAIAGIATYGVIKSSSTANAQIVAILTSAFTAIGTMTTAYFGIKAVTNTAQTAVTQTAPATTTQQTTTDTATTTTTTTTETTPTATETTPTTPTTTPTSTETTDAPTGDEGEGTDQGEGTGEGRKPDEVP